MEKFYTKKIKMLACLFSLGFSTNAVAQTQCDLINKPTISQNGNALVSSTASSYQWYQVPNYSTALGTQSTFTPTAPGGYVVYVYTFGCYKTSEVYNYNCTFNVSSVINGMTVTVTSQEPVASYQWSVWVNGPKGASGYQVISGATSNTYTATASGTYNLDIQLANGCKGVGFNGVIDGTITQATDMTTNSNADLYPNPVKDVLNVNGKAVIVNLAGQTVAEGEHKIDVSSLKSGIYLVKMNAQIFKLVKE